MRAGCDYGGVDFVDLAPDFGGGSGCHFFDFFNGVEFVAGVDALGGVSGEEVDVEFEA